MGTGAQEFSAPGKVILFGEHAVVYGRPAVAVPLTQVRAIATIEPGMSGAGLTIVASDIGARVSLSSAPGHDPLATAARLTLARLSATEPDITLNISSTIPIASGLGSGAAVSAALVRAVAGAVGHALDANDVNSIVFQVEKLHHGTPSGIDNSVVCFERPVYFVRHLPIQHLAVRTPFDLLIGDTGRASPTKKLVGQVRAQWQRRPGHFEHLFDQIGEIVDEAREAIEGGGTAALGPLMDENHAILAKIGVSSPLLDDLVDSARTAGAVGAKLSGAGRGGNMIALVEDDEADEVTKALKRAGAAQVIRATVREAID